MRAGYRELQELTMCGQPRNMLRLLHCWRHVLRWGSSSDVCQLYHRIVAVRDGRFRTRVYAVLAGLDEGAELGLRVVLAPHAMKTRWQ